MEEKIEKDTEASEDVTVDLLPEGKFPTALDLFSISVRNAALRGWVKQPSPCCAASSIAGCFNTIRGLDRKAEGAISHADVIAVMDEQLDEERAAKHASAARLLGLREPAALIALERRVGAIQDAKGRPLTLRKKEALKPPELRVAVKEAAAAFAKGEYTDADETEAEMWTALNEIYDAANTAEEAIAADDPSTIGGAGAPPAGRMPLSILHSISAGKAVGAEGEEDEGEEDESAPSCRGMLDAGAPEGAGAISLKADVNKAIISALKVHIGQLKLRSEHPSTAFFGNGDVLKAVRRMSDKLGLNVVGKTFCGKDVHGAHDHTQRSDTGGAGGTVAAARHRVRSQRYRAPHAYDQPLLHGVRRARVDRGRRRRGRRHSPCEAGPLVEARAAPIQMV